MGDEKDNDELESIAGGTEADSVAALTSAAMEVKHVNQTPFVVVPQNYRVEDLRHLLDAPPRIQGRIVAHDVAGFVEYWGRFATDESAIFSDPADAPSLHAILDYHVDAQTPRWGDHVLRYDCPVSRPWREWRTNDKTWMSQVELAEFIEDNIDDITTPDDEKGAATGAQMLELARGFSVKRNVNFSSAVRLQSGDHELTYEETTAGQVHKKSIEAPERFFLGLPVFENGEVWKVRADFRFRLRDGALSMCYRLYRTDLIKREAFKQMIEEVEEQTGVQVIAGMPR